jgi:hypothetical protein
MSKKTPKVLFTAIVLTPESKKLLLRVFPESVPRNTHAHHMTIKFKPSEEEVAALDMGAMVDLTIIGYAACDKIQAVAVTGFDSDNDIAHITVSTDGKTGPKESNTLLALGHRPIPDHALVVLSGEIKAVYPTSRALGKSTPELQVPEPPSAIDLARPDDLRARGWWVACHNDYMVDGTRRTFWLLTKGDACVQSRGATDKTALNHIRADLRRRGIR